MTRHLVCYSRTCTNAFLHGLLTCSVCVFYIKLCICKIVIIYVPRYVFKKKKSIRHNNLFYEVLMSVLYILKQFDAKQGI